MVFYGIYMILALILQTMVFTKVRPLGVTPMVLPAVAIAVGMFESATWGSVFSLIMGILADMAFVENTVMFTLLFPSLAFGANFVAQFFINKRFVGYMGVCLVGVFITAFVQMVRVIATVSFAPIMIYVLILQTLWSMVPAVLAYFPPAKLIKRYEDEL